MNRQKKKIKISNDFVILVNGKTEKLYFDAVKEIYKNETPYSLKVLQKSGTPLTLVQEAIKIRQEYRNIWCVFDIDDSFEEKNLEIAIKFANEYDIGLAWSNESFEGWLINHFEPFNTNCNRRQLIQKLNSILFKNKYKFAYSKTNEAFLEGLVKEKIQIAIQNTKVEYQIRERQHQLEFSGNKGYRIWEWKTSSCVFKLIDALKINFRK